MTPEELLLKALPGIMVACEATLEAARISLKRRIEETGKPLSGVDVDVVIGRLTTTLREARAGLPTGPDGGK